VARHRNLNGLPFSDPLIHGWIGIARQRDEANQKPRFLIGVSLKIQDGFFKPKRRWVGMARFANNSKVAAMPHFLIQ
jgi:hypothetical protein